MRTFLILCLLSLPAFATVPVRSCNQASTSGTLTCSITVAAHHLVVPVIFSAGGTTITYSDTQGNTVSQPTNPGCNLATIPLCVAGVAYAATSSVSFGSHSMGVLYFSTGSFSGSDTFTVTGQGTTHSFLYVAEYAEDLSGIDATSTAASPTPITTVGTTDLIIATSTNGGVAVCSAFSPASGFTTEFSSNAGCNSVTDRDGVAAGTYNTATTATGSDSQLALRAVAFGVVPTPPTSAVKHRSQIY